MTPGVTVTVPMLSYQAREDISDVYPLIEKLEVVIAHKGVLNQAKEVMII